MNNAGAIIYCEGAFGTPNGKTAHGLIRHTHRYHVLSVVDSQFSGQDAGMVVEGRTKNIPVWQDIPTAFDEARAAGFHPTHLVIGLAPDGGRLDPKAREDVKKAIQLGLHIDSGLHDLLSEDSEITGLAETQKVVIRDIRKTPPRDALHFFCGKIEEVTSFKIAVLGTDSAIGKRTTAGILVEALRNAGHTAEIIGTGQTAWMQGAEYCIILDSLINDFVAGEIEHVIYRAWKEKNPDFIIIEGQGSLMNPAYPGGFEILAAGRPDGIILQHAPARKEYDGFPGYLLHPIEKQIKAIELLSGKPVVAITINHEHLDTSTISQICSKIEEECGIPTCDVLLEDAHKLVTLLLALKERKMNG
ncbi:MAG: DUF1611 domain-containing protein [bacterium]